MAGDIRDQTNSSPGANLPSSATDSGKPNNYETFNVPPPSANALPEGSGLNTAGAHPQLKDAIGDAFKTVRLGDFKQVHLYPCVKDSLMMGIGGAFGMGGIRALWGGKLPFKALPHEFVADFWKLLYRRRRIGLSARS